MGIVADALTAIPGESLIKLAPLLTEVAWAAMNHEDEKALAASLDPISRGEQYAKETGDTSLLTKAVHDFLSKHGRP
jgi:hypothetical protein